MISCAYLCFSLLFQGSASRRKLIQLTTYSAPHWFVDVSTDLFVAYTTNFFGCFLLVATDLKKKKKNSKELQWFEKEDIFIHSFNN